MHIRKMNATFGRLEQAELSLQPGLNVIYAPNESGKSTWCRFIRNMFYGLSTGERGTKADKNRYAPWSGVAMRGRMDLSTDGADYTLTRETRRAAAPMGEFSCTYSDTATAVPGITGQNAGEVLLGVSREVFERSAFIGQAALAVDQDAELERRIAALITTGEEDTSYSEAYDRLKKQLNRRRHNKTGLIPALERDIDGLNTSLLQLEDLQAQHALTAQRLEQSRQQLEELQLQQQQWELLEQRQKWQQFREAEQAADQARQKSDTMAELAGSLPDDPSLSRMEAQCAALTADSAEVRQAQQAADEAAARARDTDEACRSHPLYPADEHVLQDRLNSIALPEIPSPLPFWLNLALSVLNAVAAALSFCFHKAPALTIATAASCLLTAAFAVIWNSYRSRTQRQRQQAEQAKAELEQQKEEYLPLRQAARDAADAAAQADGLYGALSKRQADAVAALLGELAPFRSVSDLSSASTAIDDLRRQANALAQAEQAARDAAMRRDLLRQHLPEGGIPDAPARQPAMSRGQVEAALPQTAANLQAAQSRLDTLTGQIRSLGDPDDLISRRQQKLVELDRLRSEYDAISLAMDALEDANLTLQNRFSPALGARAAEIFSSITGGKYNKVLLSRDFSLAAEPSDDATARSIQLLSQGAADQLYLSVRLAICDLVLPRDKAAPLILDDALISFDDDRLHAALDYLLRESEHRQILLFTCQKREQAYLAGRENAALISL